MKLSVLLYTHNPSAMAPATVGGCHLFQLKLDVLSNLMNENQEKKQEKKTASAYLILTTAFVVIFGGITLMEIFIAHLGYRVAFLIRDALTGAYGKPMTAPNHRQT